MVWLHLDDEPRIDIKNGCFTNHPFMHGGLGGLPSLKKTANAPKNITKP